MYESCTAGAQRALDRAAGRARRRAATAVDALDLLAALLDEPESRAVMLLTEGQPERLDELVSRLAIEPWIEPVAAAGEGSEPELEREPAEPALPLDAELRSILASAQHLARAGDRSRSIGTEHLLASLVDASAAVLQRLQSAGIDPEPLACRVGEIRPTEPEAIPLEPDLGPLDLTGPAEEFDLFRILDASANRAGEGLRVAEDYVRFVLDDPLLTRRLKDVRHRFGVAVRALDLESRLAARDTRGDVGTHITTPTEQVRENPRAVLAAAFRRTAEALRSLEEYTKLSDVWLSSRFEILRYDIYTLEKLVLTAVRAQATLADARLCVLVGGFRTLGELTWLVGEALAGGAQVIQLREKQLPDQELLRRAREARILTYQARALFVMNDRPDLARLAGADGVHLGQDDLGTRDARRIVGPRSLLGRSTHDVEQLDRAVVEGASYLGVGPVFPSETKSFEDLAGLAYVRAAAERSRLPWFAIGGIDETNLDEVIGEGATRIAVSSAVTRADRPREAAARLRRRLDELQTSDD